MSISNAVKFTSDTNKFTDSTQNNENPGWKWQYVFLWAYSEYWVHVFVLYSRQSLSGIYGSTYFRYFWRQTFSCFITLPKTVRRFNKWSKTKKNWIFSEHIFNLQNNLTLLNEEITWTPFSTGTVSTLFHCTRFVVQFRRTTCQDKR